MRPTPPRPRLWRRFLESSESRGRKTALDVVRKSGDELPLGDAYLPFSEGCPAGRFDLASCSEVSLFGALLHVLPVEEKMKPINGSMLKMGIFPPLTNLSDVTDDTPNIHSDLTGYYPANRSSVRFGDNPDGITHFLGVLPSGRRLRRSKVAEVERARGFPRRLDSEDERNSWRRPLEIRHVDGMPASSESDLAGY